MWEFAILLSTAAIAVVTLKLIVETGYIMWAMLLGWIVSWGLYVGFVLIYSALPEFMSSANLFATTYALLASPTFYLATFLIIFLSILPDITARYLQFNWFPRDWGILLKEDAAKRSGWKILRAKHHSGLAVVPAPDIAVRIDGTPKTPTNMGTNTTISADSTGGTEMSIFSAVSISTPPTQPLGLNGYEVLVTPPSEKQLQQQQEQQEEQQHAPRTPTTSSSVEQQPSPINLIL